MKKSIKIAHIADIHVRPYQYMDEMKFTFEKFFESIEREKVDLVFIGGDFFHSKLTVSNEYFQIAFSFFKELAEICPSVIIPGNHDSVLSNQGRLDAITPIVNSVNEFGKHRIWHLVDSKSLSVPHEIGLDNVPEISFHHFSIHDSKLNWPNRDNLDSKEINIALYHGCIESCTLDNGWVSRGNRDDISIFDGFDYAFLGDIHKRQFLNNDKTIAYPGSLRQNNFGEDIDKGYLLWTIFGKDDFKVEEVILEQKRYFFTIPISSIQDLEAIGELPEDCRIRVKCLKALDVAEEIEIKRAIVEKYKPTGEVLFVPPDEKIENTTVKVGNLDIIHDNIREVEVQKELITEYLKKKNVDQPTIDKVRALDKIYHANVDTDVLRNITYDIKSMEFDNMFSYGKDNKIDFTKLKGMIGVFGPTGAGKSSIFDVMCFAMQNSIYKTGANKNGDYVNRKCKKAEVKLELELNKEKYVIKREIKRTYTEGKPEPKIENSVDFYSLPKTKESMLNGETIPETNKFIRSIFGEKEDLEVTSYCPQWNLTSFIDSRGTKRKEALSTFFDLGVFDTKYNLALEDHKEIKGKLKSCNKTELMKQSDAMQEVVLKLSDERDALENSIEMLEVQSSALESQILTLVSEKKFVEKNLPKLDEKEIEAIAKKLDELNKIDEETEKSIIRRFDELTQKEKQHSKLAVKLKIYKNNSDLISKIPNQEICKSCSLASGAYEALDKFNETTKEQELIAFNPDKFKEIQLEYSKIQESKILKADITEKLVLGKKYLENKNAIEENERTDRIIDDFRKSKNSIEFEIKKKRGEHSDLSSKIGFNLAKISEIESKLTLEEDLSDKDKILSLYLDCMGKDGISYWIISKKLILINKLVNQILAHATNFKFVIEDNDEEKSIKMFIVNNGSKTPVELASGGEKTLIAIALRAALWKICLLPKTPILILDESLVFLDNEKYDSTIKLLKYLSSSYFEKIFLITHDEELKRTVDDSIFVSVKKNGFSSCEVK